VSRGVADPVQWTVKSAGWPTHEIQPHRGVIEPASLPTHEFHYPLHQIDNGLLPTNERIIQTIQIFSETKSLNPYRYKKGLTWVAFTQFCVIIDPIMSKFKESEAFVQTKSWFSSDR
jgi:hypothetical protein